MVTSDIVLDETVEFIRSTQRNVKLALAVEEAMGELRNRVYGKLMSALQACLKRSKGTWHITLVYPGKRKRGESFQIEGIRLHQKINWTSKGPWGGVWLARNDNDGVVQIGVDGFRSEPEKTKEALANAFEVVVRRGEDRMDGDVVKEECLLAKGDDQIEQLASEMAGQMIRLVRAIKDS